MFFAKKIGPLFIYDTFQLTVGVFGHESEEALIDRPLPPSEIATRLFATCLPYDIPAAVLEQELIIALGKSPLPPSEIATRLFATCLPYYREGAE